ncbi:uncharacterized protein [Penaeus vannamei]|uniref:uncharacterized protein n=1 Tax=Penaeus vannamei TaxID=6689 RepID=UPI00387FAB03
MPQSLANRGVKSFPTFQNPFFQIHPQRDFRDSCLRMNKQVDSAHYILRSQSVHARRGTCSKRTQAMASLRLTLCAAFAVVLMAAVEVRSETVLCTVRSPKTGCPAYLSEQKPPANSHPRCECDSDYNCARGHVCCVNQAGFGTSCYTPEGWNEIIAMRVTSRG